MTYLNITAYSTMSPIKIIMLKNLHSIKNKYYYKLNFIKNVEPCGLVLAVSFALCRAAIPKQTAKPNPVPFSLVVKNGVPNRSTIS